MIQDPKIDSEALQVLSNRKIKGIRNLSHFRPANIQKSYLVQKKPINFTPLKILNILRCFFEKNFFFHERHKNFFPSKNYEDNISPNFLNTFFDPSNKFKANFKVLEF